MRRLVTSAITPTAARAGRNMRHDLGFSPTHEQQASSGRAESHIAESHIYDNEMRLGGSQHEPQYVDERMQAGEHGHGHQSEAYYEDDVPARSRMKTRCTTMRRAGVVMAASQPHSP